MKIREHLPLVEAPESIWASIEAALEAKERRRWPSLRWRLAFAVLAISMIAGTLWWRVAGRDHWIQTGANAGLTLRIGDIGSVEVGPNTRVRVVADRVDQHRLDLAHGAIYARISAPPRLFFVETHSGTAVDLGCEYGLTMDADGAGLLRVSRGWVSFEWQQLESLVPAGAECRIAPGGGPGIPYFEDAPEAFKNALKNLDLERVLDSARVRDTLSLWHLISRVAPGDRARVFDRIAALSPPPEDISREQALKLDPETLRRWREELAWTW